MVAIASLATPSCATSRRLLRLLVLLHNFPRVFFRLSLNDRRLSRRVVVVTASLCSAIVRQMIATRRHGRNLVSSRVRTRCFGNVRRALAPRSSQTSSRQAVQLLAVLSTLIFCNANSRLTRCRTRLAGLCPITARTTITVCRGLIRGPVGSPFSLHHGIIGLFRLFSRRVAT